MALGIAVDQDTADNPPIENSVTKMTPSLLTRVELKIGCVLSLLTGHPSSAGRWMIVMIPMFWLAAR
jgi:hypothetical protein